jgi:hypothetical protein
LAAGERGWSVAGLLVVAALTLFQAQPALATPAPTVSAISPNSGANTGSVSVTVTGTRFESGLTAKLQKTGLADIPATDVTVVSATRFTCSFDLTGRVPGAWDVSVKCSNPNPGTLPGGFTITSPVPTVNSIAPNKGVNDGTVSITNLAGTNFFPGATVSLKKTGQTDIIATGVNVVSTTQITCALDLTGKPTGAWDVVVTNTDGQSGTLAGGFTIANPAPTVTSITPNSAPNSGIVGVTDLAGTNFQAGAGVKLQKTGEADTNAAHVTIVSTTQITCTFDLTGKAIGAWDVVVTNPDAQSASLPGGFTVSAAPDNGLTGPTIGNITRTSAVVNWTTATPSSSIVGYGTWPQANYSAYPNHGFGPGGSVYHAVTLAGLQPDTTYYLCVQSEAAGEAVESGTVSFTTSSLTQPGLVYTGDTTGEIRQGKGNNVTLAATLTDGGTPVVGKTVSFVCGGVTGAATTDGTGRAAAQVLVARLGAGTRNVYCRFTGDTAHLPATATGSISVTGPADHTIIRGAGYFHKNGDRSQRCSFKFRFDASLVAGWLTFHDVRTRYKIDVNVVKSIVLSPNATSGPQATIVCGPNDAYTLTVDADSDAIQITDGSYAAQSSQASGSITIEEAGTP